MSLEDRIVKRWQEWWYNRAFELREKHMRELIVLALEEIKKGMVEPRFTVKEMIAIEHLLSTVQAFVSPELPMTDSERVGAIQKLITPEVLSALGKLHMELSNIKQAQERLAGIDGINTTDETGVIRGAL